MKDSRANHTTLSLRNNSHGYYPIRSGQNEGADTSTLSLLNHMVIQQQATHTKPNKLKSVKSLRPGANRPTGATMLAPRTPQHSYTTHASSAGAPHAHPLHTLRTTGVIACARKARVSGTIPALTSRSQQRAGAHRYAYRAACAAAIIEQLFSAQYESSNRAINT